ncbi:MAG: hypothetical protein IT449_16665 [Phycisphaerales bacterium]|nr:hypothetical protein [Phycisphaerales bacterium]
MTRTWALIVLSWALVGAPDAPADEPRVIYVNDDATGSGDGTSWENAMPSLKDALDFAAAGDEIWVAAGVYKPSRHPDNRAASFLLISGVGVYGGFAGFEKDRSQRDPALNSTTLSGDLRGDDGPDFAHTGDNSLHVVKVDVGGAAPVLDGFTIAGGNASGNRHTPAASGGGVVIRRGSFNLVNCTVIDCQGALGGGLYNAGPGYVTLTNCTVARNRAHSGGGACGPFELSHTAFEDNHAESRGGAIYGSCAAEHALFAGNRAEKKGGAIMGPAVVTHSAFVRNHAGRKGGAAFGRQASLSATNTLFLGNYAGEFGGVVYAHGRANPYFNHCTLAFNATEENDATICFTRDQSAPRFFNSILWRNYLGEVEDPYGPQFWVFGNHDEVIRYSCVEGIRDVGGEHGNIADDPRVADLFGPDGEGGTGDENLRLTGDSPCIDAGWKDRPVPTDETDLDDAIRCIDDPYVEDTGKGRPPLPDMGAYEFKRK